MYNIMLIQYNAKYECKQQVIFYFCYLPSAQSRCMLNLPDCNNLTRIKFYSIHLRYENCCHCLVKSCAVHVDCCTNRKHKSSNPFINAQVFLQTAKRNRQRPSTDNRHTLSVKAFKPYLDAFF